MNSPEHFCQENKVLLGKVVGDARNNILKITTLISLSLYDSLVKLKNEDHVSCPSSLASRLLSEFFPSPLQGVKARNFFDSQSLYSERRLGIFLSPRTYMEETVRRETPNTSLRSVLHQQAVFEGGESLEFFQVPGRI